MTRAVVLKTSMGFEKSIGAVIASLPKKLNECLGKPDVNTLPLLSSVPRLKSKRKRRVRGVSKSGAPFRALLMSVPRCVANSAGASSWLGLGAS
jgi:hypothetical protein